jgi:uncharacterized membrane protein
MALFDSAALARIESTIKGVESHTSGEIVVVSVPRSDAYHEVRLAYGVAFALAGASIVHMLVPGLAIGALLWIEAAIVVVAWLAFNIAQGVHGSSFSNVASTTRAIIPAC